MPAGDVSVTAEFAQALTGTVTVASDVTDVMPGAILTATVAEPNAEADTLSYQWVTAATADAEEWTDVTGATDATYTVKATDTGFFKCVVTSTDATYDGEIVSAATTAVDTNKLAISAEVATWVKSGDTTAHGEEDTDLKLETWTKANDSTLSTNAVTLLRYAGLDEISNKNEIYTAKLNMNIASTSYNDSRSRWENGQFAIGTISDNTWDASTLVFTDYESIRSDSLEASTNWTANTDASTPKDAGQGAYANANLDVTKYVKAATNDKITFEMAVATARSQTVKRTPKLIITFGKVVTFNVTAAANSETKVANAAIAVKNGDETVANLTTNSDGVASVVLLENSGDYTYTVTSADYAIKSDGEFTVEEDAVTENIALAANVPTTIEITPPTSTAIGAGESATYTATVKDQDGRAMTSTVDWAVTLDATSEADAAVTIANGVVTTTDAAVGGAYTVTATVNGTSISDTEALTVSKLAKVNVSITANDANGTVAYTVDGVASTDTQILPGKTIVATATPNSLYGFAGWATSSENAAAGTYIENAGAEYTVTTQEGTDITLIAVFEYNGIYYQEDFDDSDVNGSGTEIDADNYNLKSQDGVAAIYQRSEGNNYALMSPNGGGGRGMAFTFKNLPALTEDYTLEMDISLATGNSGTDHNFWLATSSVSGANATAPSSYAFKLTAANSGDTTWTVSTLAADATATTATILGANRRTSSTSPSAASTWSHVKMEVDVSEKTAVLTITTEGQTSFSQTINFTGDSVTPTAIKMATPRYNPILALDNIIIKKTETASVGD